MGCSPRRAWALRKPRPPAAGGNPLSQRVTARPIHLSQRGSGSDKRRAASRFSATLEQTRCTTRTAVDGKRLTFRLPVTGHCSPQIFVAGVERAKYKR